MISIIRIFKNAVVQDILILPQFSLIGSMRI